jgi:hypothetical protein
MFGRPIARCDAASHTTPSIFCRLSTSHPASLSVSLPGKENKHQSLMDGCSARGVLLFVKTNKSYFAEVFCLLFVAGLKFELRCDFRNG